MNILDGIVLLAQLVLNELKLLAKEKLLLGTVHLLLSALV